MASAAMELRLIGSTTWWKMRQSLAPSRRTACGRSRASSELWTLNSTGAFLLPLSESGVLTQ